MQICILVGNPKPGSRTLTLAQSLAARIAADEDTIDVIDLAEHAEHLFAWPSETMSRLNEQAAGCDLLIVATPTYKATYTGMLKAFLDRYPNLGLRDVSAIPVMTGADKGHSMAPEVNLRPLLVELGALVPTRGLYFETPAMDRMDEILEEWAQANALGLVQVRAAAQAKTPAVAR